MLDIALGIKLENESNMGKKKIIWSKIGNFQEIVISIIEKRVVQLIGGTNKKDQLQKKNMYLILLTIDKISSLNYHFKALLFIGSRYITYLLHTP